jgi:precorrin-2 methylase
VRKLRLIGIGCGDPEQLTLQAVMAPESIEAVFVLYRSGEGRLAGELAGR